MPGVFQSSESAVSSGKLGSIVCGGRLYSFLSISFVLFSSS